MIKRLTAVLISFVMAGSLIGASPVYAAGEDASPTLEDAAAEAEGESEEDPAAAKSGGNLETAEKEKEPGSVESGDSEEDPADKDNKDAGSAGDTAGGDEEDPDADREEGEASEREEGEDAGNKEGEDSENEEDRDADNEEDESVESEEEDETELPLMGTDAEIEEGWYRIATAVDPGFVMDVAGGSTAVRANIQIYPNNGTAAQIFYIKRDEDGSYTLRNRKSLHYLNVAHGDMARGANIWQYKDDGTDAMKFRILESETEGCVKIVSVLSGLPVDISGGKAVKRTNVQLWRDNGTLAQRWLLKSVPPKEAASLKTGYYSFENVGSSPQVLDVRSAGTADGTFMQIHKSNGTAAQVFYVEAMEDETFTIMACCSGRYLMPKGGICDEGTPIVQQTVSGSSSQRWKVFNVSGFLQIAPAEEEGRVLSVSGTDAKSVTLRTEDEGDDQLWLAVSAAEPQVAPAQGLYTVRVSGQSRYVLDVDNGSTGTANIRIHHSNGTDAQKFLFMKNSDGTLTITNAGSFMALDVKSAGTADGTNVQQHTANNDSNAQKWTVKGCPGRYRIISACGNKPLTVDGAVEENTNAVISADRGGAGQRFALDAASTAALPLDKQIYRITTSKETWKAIDVPDAGYAEGLLMRIHTSNYTDAQKWQFISTGDGYYVIQNVKSGLCLTAKAYGGSTWGSAKGTTVIQYNEIEGNSYKQYQKWRPVPAGDGGYYLQNWANGLYLDVKGGSTAQDTPLQVYPGNQTAAQKFYLNRVSTSCYLRWHDYATDSKGVRHWLEGTFWDDPKVSDVDFLAAAIYTEGGSQGMAGMMMIGYSMLNRSTLQDMRYTIYEYGQYQICRDGALTRILRAISSNQTSSYSNLDAARSAARNCSSGSPIVLTSSAVLTYPGGQRTLGSGAVIRRSDFAIYNGFMTPAAWNRHGFSTANKHTCTYLGHIYYVTKEVW